MKGHAAFGQPPHLLKQGPGCGAITRVPRRDRHTAQVLHQGFADLRMILGELLQDPRAGAQHIGKVFDHRGIGGFTVQLVAVQHTRDFPQRRVVLLQQFLRLGERGLRSLLFGGQCDVAGHQTCKAQQPHHHRRCDGCVVPPGPHGQTTAECRSPRRDLPPGGEASQILGKGGRRLITIVRIPGDGLFHNGAQVCRHLIAGGSQRLRSGLGNLLDERST